MVKSHTSSTDTTNYSLVAVISAFGEAEVATKGLLFSLKIHGILGD